MIRVTTGLTCNGDWKLRPKRKKKKKKFFRLVEPYFTNYRMVWGVLFRMNFSYFLRGRVFLVFCSAHSQFVWLRPAVHIMGDAAKDKKSSKKSTKEGTLGKAKASSSAPAPAAAGMPGPAPIDNPAFDKLHSIQKDWAQREWIETVNGSMKRIVDFLNKFGTPSRSSRFTYPPLSPPNSASSLYISSKRLKSNPKSIV